MTYKRHNSIEFIIKIEDPLAKRLQNKQAELGYNYMNTETFLQMVHMASLFALENDDPTFLSHLQGMTGAYLETTKN